MHGNKTQKYRLIEYKMTTFIIWFRLFKTLLKQIFPVEFKINQVRVTILNWKDSFAQKSIKYLLYWPIHLV